MPDYCNPVTGVVVRVPAEVGDRLAGFQPVPTAVADVKPEPKRATRRKKADA